MELYEINSYIRSLYELYESGEIEEQAYKDTMESLGIEMAVEEYIKMIRNAEANASKLKEEADKLRNKADSESRKAEFHKKLIIGCLDALQEKKLDAGIFKVTMCMSKSADVTDISLISETYLEPQPPKVNKKALLADLKAGREISGAKIKESPYIRIL